MPPRFEGLPTASSQDGPSEWVLDIYCLTSREGGTLELPIPGTPTRRIGYDAAWLDAT